MNQVDTLVRDSDDINNYQLKFNSKIINTKVLKKRSSSCKTSSIRMPMNKLAKSKCYRTSYDVDIVESTRSCFDVDNVTSDEEEENCDDGCFIEVNTRFANSFSSQEIVDVFNKNYYVIRRRKCNIYY